MQTPDIKNRLTSHLNRLNAWLEDSVQVLSCVERELEEDLDGALERHERLSGQFDHLLREHHVLLREWLAAKNVTPADRAEIMQLAEQSSQLLKDYQEAQQRTFALTQAHLDACEEEIKRHGGSRRMIKKYRPGGDGDEGNIDHRA
jgi:ABC-type transporter Mla subunit MlaD